MRGFLLLLIGVGSLFLDAFLIQWIANTIVGPYGQHGYTYAQAFNISFALTTSTTAALVIMMLIKALLD